MQAFVSKLRKGFLPQTLRDVGAFKKNVDSSKAQKINPSSQDKDDVMDMEELELPEYKHLKTILQDERKAINEVE